MECWCVPGIAFAVSTGEWICSQGEMSHTALSVLVLRENDTIFQEKKKSSNRDNVAFWFQCL